MLQLDAIFAATGMERNFRCRAISSTEPYVIKKVLYSQAMGNYERRPHPPQFILPTLSLRNILLRDKI
jgi:hypothetical protein